MGSKSNHGDIIVGKKLLAIDKLISLTQQWYLIPKEVKPMITCGERYMGSFYISETSGMAKTNPCIPVPEKRKRWLKMESDGQNYSNHLSHSA